MSAGGVRSSGAPASRTGAAAPERGAGVSGAEGAVWPSGLGAPALAESSRVAAAFRGGGRRAGAGVVLASVILARRAQLLFENANAVLQLLDRSRHGSQLALQPVDAGREPGVSFELGVVGLVHRRASVDLRDLDARFGGEGGVRAGEQDRGGEAVNEAGGHGERRLFKGVARLFAGAIGSIT